MPAPLNMAARRAMVEQLRRQEPGVSARQIADRLGVGKDTILRDIAAIEAEQRQRAAAVTTTAPPGEPPAPGTELERDTLVLQLDEPLRQALAVLRAQVGAADTQRANRRAARAAIRSVADRLIEENGGHRR